MLEAIPWEEYLSDFQEENLPDIIKKICETYGFDPKAQVPLTFEQVLTYFLHALVKKKLQIDTPPPTSFTLQEEKKKEIERQHFKRGELVENVVQQAIKQKLLHDENPVIDLFSWKMYTSRLDNLTQAFNGSHFIHAVAVKANPLRGLLREAQRRGLGAECASFAEAKHSLSLGFTPRQIIYDSPCKTMGELKEMLLEGVYINLDNEQEIEKVATIFRTLPNTRMKEHDAQIGLRINPLVGSGTIAATSTATANSKFGLPWTEATHEKIYEFFEKYSWLQGVHVHVGSQGCPLELLVIGAKKAVDFVKKINQRLGKKQIKIIDIGGGLPTIYDGISKIEQANDFEVYAKALEKQVHELFTGEFQVITEFGRSLFVKPGMTISKVEAVKNWGETNQPIAVIHVGANQFLRTAYLPKVWPHQLSVFTKEGKLKKKDFLSQDIAGPLCFSGDFIARKVFLPRIEVGDYLVIHDTGGYTLSMYSKYNSRCASSVFAYIDEDCKDTKDTKDFKDFKDFKDSKDSNKALMKFAMLKERETVTQTLAFWGNQAVDVHLLFS